MQRIILLDIDDVILLPRVSSHEWYRARKDDRPAFADVRVPKSAKSVDVQAGGGNYRSWFRPQVIAGLVEASRHANIIWSTSWLALPNELETLTDALGLRGHVGTPENLEDLEPSRYGTDDTSRWRASAHWKVKHAREWLDAGYEVLWLENQLNSLILGVTTSESEKMRALHWVSPTELSWTAADGGKVGNPGLIASDMSRVISWAAGDPEPLRIQRGTDSWKMTAARWESLIRATAKEEASATDRG